MTRLRALLVAVVVLVAAAVAVTAVAVASPSRPPGPGPAGPDPATGTARAAGARPAPLQLGVTVLALWRDWDDREHLLDTARDNGASWIRVDSGWCSLEEQGPGQVSSWYQDRMDTVVRDARARGLQVLMMVGCPPAWAGGADAQYNGYPDDDAEFTRVMTYLAGRYRGQVAAWQIANEPDCFGGCGNGDPERYVPFLQAGYRGVKAGSPDALVVTAGTSGVDVDWYRRLYDTGAAGWFDAVAVHPYLDPATAPPDAPPEGRRYRLTSLPDLRRLMVERGDAAKPIWFTEFGWTTADTGDRPGVDPGTQARYLSEAVQQVQQRYPYVSHAFWFTLVDRDDSTPYENEFGLLNRDGSPKPALGAFRQSQEWLRGR
ncbi:cellulase family glycosylhydrolase [Pseudonocardia phyllosphaerae]|uniref:cellulase family glycosylhydrolase n=1 Tax=Pseudonocardia phyllosphaerae TaxID=3390502 RepID=UPI0039785C6A